VIDRVLTVQQVADHLGVTPRTVLRLIHQPGGIPHLRLGRGRYRIPETLLNQWLRDTAKSTPRDIPDIPDVRTGPRLVHPALAPAEPDQPTTIICPTTGRIRAVRPA